MASFGGRDGGFWGRVRVAIYENPGFPNPGFRNLWKMAMGSHNRTGGLQRHLPSRRNRIVPLEARSSLTFVMVVFQVCFCPLSGPYLGKLIASNDLKELLHHPSCNPLPEIKIA